MNIRYLFFLTVLVSSCASIRGTLDRTKPVGLKGPIISREGYSLQYYEECRVAHWVSYKIQPQNLVKNAVRKNNFKSDELLVCPQASLKDYDEPFYDRGHLARANLFTKSQDLMDESFRLSNIVPQDPYMNRYGAWRKAESFEYKLAKKSKSIFVVSGPVISKLQTERIGDVCVPLMLYKVIYEPGENKGYAFLIPNQKEKKNLEDYVTTIDEIEKLTGLDFFHELPDTEETIIESQINYPSFNQTSTLASYDETPYFYENDPMVKKSRRNICHEKGSTYYRQTVHFTSFRNIQDCVSSGGRLPQR